MIQHLNILWYDHYSKSSNHLSSYKFIAVLLTVFPVLYITSPWLMYFLTGSLYLLKIFFFKGIPLFFVLFIYLFLAVLGLHFCARAFSSCSKRGPLFIAVRGPLTIAASLVAEHGLQMHRLSSCGSRAQSLWGMWDLPRPGLEPVFPALAGRFSTTAPPGKPPLEVCTS